MERDILSCDISDVLINNNFSILQKLNSWCSDFRTQVAAVIDSTTAIELGEENKAVEEKISVIEKEIKDMYAKLDDTELQQKIVKKKLTRISEQKENIIRNIDDAKKHRESLHLNIVELQAQREERKNQKRLSFDALKRACATYKKYLDIHLTLLESEDQEEKVKVTLFINDDATKDKFYVYLSSYENLWKVLEIHPTLKEDHLNDLRTKSGASGNFEIDKVPLFLCNLRDIYLKHYMIQN